MESTKLSFSLPSKSSSKPNPKRPTTDFALEQPNSNRSQQELITEFDPSKTLAPTKPTYSIPRLENTWNPYKKMKNIDIALRSASDDPDLRFEVEAPTTADASDSSMSYGLNLRSTDADSKNWEDGDMPVVRPSSTENVLLQKYKEDMKNLPDDRGMEEFEDVPVEGFGAALLKGYGWSEGKGIGRNAKEDVKVVQYLRRGDKEGLGFVPDAASMEQKGGKSGKPKQEVLVAPKGPNGKTRHVVGVDEKLVPRQLKGIHVGKIVRVVGGRHYGLKGKVLEKFHSESVGSILVVLKLKNDEEVTVGIKDVAELGSVDEEICLEEMKSRSSKDERRKERRDSSSHRESERRKGGRDDKKKDKRSERDDEKYSNGSAHPSNSRDNRSKEEEKMPAVSWLTSHIRVRIISKDFKGGKLYLKKGVILDVVGPNTCDISLDETKQLIQGVSQDILETAIPKRGGSVLVLYGEHRGVFGYLMERNMEKETGVVQDADSHSLLNVNLEQIAEYTGDPSCIGY